MSLIEALLAKEGIVTAFATVGVIMYLSSLAAKYLTGGRIHGSAIAIVTGIVLAYIGGRVSHGHGGIADLPMFGGFALMGGGLFRDFSVTATAFNIDIARAKRAGWIGFTALVLGTILPFLVGVVAARAYGYTDPVVVTTIAAGCVTYIVGGVTGGALGAPSGIVAVAVAIGVLKAILIMIATPIVAPYIGLDNSRTAMAYGGMMGSISGVTAGLGAVNPRLIPYGALVTTFHTGFGCLVCPSILFLLTRYWLGA
jgi:malonate transporter MadM subunit